MALSNHSVGCENSQFGYCALTVILKVVLIAFLFNFIMYIICCTSVQQDKHTKVEKLNKINFGCLENGI